VSDLAGRVAKLRGRIAAAAARAGRDPDEVALVAVSKRHDAARIEAAVAAGITDVGESYAQEMVAKMDQVATGTPLGWHFIGRLQRNKVRMIVGRAALIHAVDSEALAREIDRRAAAAGIVQSVLVAVNVAGEAHKSGVPAVEAAALVALCEALPAVRCDGLMTIPPPAAVPADSRPHFRALAALRDSLRTPTRPLPVLSMGMSDDFEVAVEEGATLVRVGTAIFGPRPVGAAAPGGGVAG
jgi:PLP dependent protein